MTSKQIANSHLEMPPFVVSPLDWRCGGAARPRLMQLIPASRPKCDTGAGRASCVVGCREALRCRSRGPHPACLHSTKANAVTDACMQVPLLVVVHHHGGGLHGLV
jgi:hypothetical protein